MDSEKKIGIKSFTVSLIIKRKEFMATSNYLG